MKKLIVPSIKPAARPWTIQTKAHCFQSIVGGRGKKILAFFLEGEGVVGVDMSSKGKGDGEKEGGS